MGISIHEVRVWRALSAEWRTILELASAAGVARRTASLHCGRFVEMGLAERAEVFPGYRFRRATTTGEISSSYAQQLEAAGRATGE